MQQPTRLDEAMVPHAPPGKHSDGGGLTLLVKPSGRRSWVARVSVNGKRRDIGLGGYPEVTLDEARSKAAQFRAEAADRKAAGNGAAGADTAASLRAQHLLRMPTFGEAAAAVHALNAPRWRSERYAAEWLDSLRRHAAPLWHTPADRITRTDVLEVLHPIWTDTPASARRVRQRIRKTLAYAMALHEHIACNPAGDGIDAALPPMPRVRSHRRALHYRDVPGALRAVAASGASDAAKLCLRFVALTATRSGEARGARWSEIEAPETPAEASEAPEAPEATWRIPAERMKTAVEHRVPLSRQALDVLEAARPLRDGSGLVFPSPLRPGAELSSQALLKLLRCQGLDTTVHGFRSSFKTWTLEATSAPWAVSEAALAHTVGNSTEVAYVRGDLFDQRRALMRAWADYAAP